MKLYKKLSIFILKQKKLIKNNTFLYAFIVILSLNFLGLTSLIFADFDQRKSRFISQIAESQSNENSDSEFGQNFGLNPELEIFQYILRNSDLNHNTALKLAETIYIESNKYKIDPFLVLAVIRVESTFKKGAVSNKGAVGLMQLMPSTARSVSKKYDIPYHGRSSLFDPLTNVRLGIAYLSHLKKRYGNIEYALWAYNFGPKMHKQVKKKFRNSKPYYVREVINFRNFLESQRIQISES